MADYITKIRTEQGDKQIDYNALANLPGVMTAETLGMGKAAEYDNSTMTNKIGVNSVGELFSSGFIPKCPYAFELSRFTATTDTFEISQELYDFVRNTKYAYYAYGYFLGSHSYLVIPASLLPPWDFSTWGSHFTAIRTDFPSVDNAKPLEINVLSCKVESSEDGKYYCKLLNGSTFTGTLWANS